MHTDECATVSVSEAGKILGISRLTATGQQSQGNYLSFAWGSLSEYQRLLWIS